MDRGDAASLSRDTVPVSIEAFGIELWHRKPWFLLLLLFRHMNSTLDTTYDSNICV